jgi:hypothetical protein
MSIVCVFLLNHDVSEIGSTSFFKWIVGEQPCYVEPFGFAA